MAKYITTQYGTKINVEGLLPEEIKKVRKTAEANGSYGSKAAALAEQFRRKQAKFSAPGASAATGASNIPQTGGGDIPPVVPGPSDNSMGGRKIITTKYGTKINVTGLTPAQIKRVLAIAEGSGAYGSKATALAQQMQRRNVKLGVGAGGESSDGTGNISETMPGGGNQGDTSTIEDKTTVDDKGNIDLGINEINKRGGLFEDPNQIWANAPEIPGANDLQAEIEKVRNANYGYLTQYNARDKALEMEAKKQELAQRGIPLDPSPDSLWGRSMQEIDRKYQALEDQARNQAIIGGDQSLTARVNAGRTASDAFMNAVLGMGDAELKLYGINKDYQARLKQIQAQRANQGGGGGGGGGAAPPNTEPIFGGAAP